MHLYQDWTDGKLKKDTPTTQIPSNEDIPTPRRRLRCKRCHSDDLSVVTEYHVERRLRFYRDLLKKLKQFIIVLGTIFFISEYTLEYALDNFLDFFVTAPFLIWAALSITVSILTAIINKRESHTHLRFVCHTCALSWICD